jgi:glutamate/tyrosine decarboxylase-like PLP-dependent enzyme
MSTAPSAFWAAASPKLRHLVQGAERADSWITDAHKWLNVPYDSALVLCADPEAHRAAMTVSASYLIQDGTRAVRDQVDWVPEFSRRARGFPVYAALRSLGRSGLAELVERTCDCARRFAEGVACFEGVEVLNEVVLNQVLFRFESDAKTDAVLRTVQEAGDVWMSGTTWDGRRAVRISVSNWQTTDRRSISRWRPSEPQVSYPPTRRRDRPGLRAGGRASSRATLRSR